MGFHRWLTKAALERHPACPQHSARCKRRRHVCACQHHQPVITSASNQTPLNITPSRWPACLLQQSRHKDKPARLCGAELPRAPSLLSTEIQDDIGRPSDTRKGRYASASCPCTRFLRFSGLLIHLHTECNLLQSD